MARRSWSFSSVRLKNKRASEDETADVFRRRGRFFSSVREDRRRPKGSEGDDVDLSTDRPGGTETLK
ncbi:hypothetical protein NFI96_015224, partial [Prochilodus magdalenae]